ncbi:MAG: hypothetical protein GYB67_03030 [Chloroflexi bacterium]|nr:hypothetical protein [Chloroflexota bacterium]
MVKRHTHALVLITLLVVLAFNGAAVGEQVHAQSFPVDADDGGGGVIVEALPGDARSIGSLNPLRCNELACRRITALLFPTLLGVDLERRAYVGGAEGGLAASWTIDPDDRRRLTFTLRDDVLWSDGTPITAYDVFYSYLAMDSGDFSSPFTDNVRIDFLGVAPRDAQRITFVAREGTCSALNRSDLPVIPAHVFAPEFADVAADAFDPDGDPLAQFEAWQADSALDFGFIGGHPFDRAPSVTAGPFMFESFDPYEGVRLIAEDGRRAYAFVDAEGVSVADLFARGEVDLVVNPSYNERQIIRALDDAQIAEYAGTVWYYIGLNLADPDNPQNAFDDDGEPLDQGRHPVFGDERVRRAMQMAIDVPALIEAVTLGSGTVIAGDQPPISWAFDPDLQPVGYDPVGASRLLDEAGWRDDDGDGIRDCVECLDATPGRSLSFQLAYADNLPDAAVTALIIEEQLRRVGMRAFLQPLSSGGLVQYALSQRHDAFLFGASGAFPVDPGQVETFTRAGDVVDELSNTSSYHNAQVEALHAELVAVATCDLDERAAIHHEIQAILQEEQPMIWLFAINEFVAARRAVTGFDPRVGDPLWNIRDWVVVR